MSGLPEIVYCFACGEKFKKSDPNGFEPCPKCGKTLSDLSEEAQYAVKMLTKSVIEHYK